MGNRNDEVINQDSAGYEKIQTKAISKSEKRRKLVRSIAATGGVAAAGFAGNQWIKPVVSTVSLPAHAQTTTLNLQRALLGIGIVGLDNNIMDFFIGTAYAGGCTLPSTFCIGKVGVNTVTFNIAGGSSLPITYMTGVPFSVTVTSMGVNYVFTNVVIINDPNDIDNDADSISGMVTCNMGIQKKTDPMGVFSGPFTPGTCAM